MNYELHLNVMLTNRATFITSSRKNCTNYFHKWVSFITRDNFKWAKTTRIPHEFTIAHRFSVKEILRSKEELASVLRVHLRSMYRLTISNLIAQRQRSPRKVVNAFVMKFCSPSCVLCSPRTLTLYETPSREYEHIYLLFMVVYMGARGKHVHAVILSVQQSFYVIVHFT